jgi:pyruvate dehydrogenase E1 component alpha subunit
MTTTTKDESAAATAALAGNHGFSLISNEKLLDLYTSMVKCRMIEERVQTISGQRQSKSNRYASAGQEAAAAGVAIDLLPGDTVIPSHRDLVVNFIKGNPLTKVLRSLSADAATPGLEGQLDLVTSAAQINKAERNGKIAVAFSSSELSSPGIWHQALMNAGANRLPILFVCRASVSDGLDSSRGQDFGFPCIPVDGSDVVAVYRVATEAITHARKGNGATLIECATWPSDGLSESDPILKMEAYLTRKGLFSKAMKREVVVGFSKELDRAIEATKRATVRSSRIGDPGM